jgi:hypothetical protein
MIYVITPFLSDFKAICIARDTHILDKSLQWVNSWKYLIGKEVFPTDEIIYGANIKEFEQAELDKIHIELKIRIARHAKINS